MANIRLESGDMDGAKKLFTSLQQKSGRRDVYAQLSLANIEFETAMISEGRKKQDHLNFALKIYKRVLQRDDSNIYAANGIGMVLAERGHLTYARDIFTKVRDSAFDAPDPAINLAKIQIQLKKYPAAIQLFQTCIQSFGPGDAGLHLSYLAAAYKVAGMNAECLKVLQRAVRLFPEVVDHWYELSSIMCIIAADMYAKFSNVISLDDKVMQLKRMKSYFASALKYRQFYIKVGGVDIDEKEKASAEQFVRKCTDHLKHIEDALVTAMKSKEVSNQPATNLHRVCEAEHMMLILHQVLDTHTHTHTFYLHTYIHTIVHVYFFRSKFHSPKPKKDIPSNISLIHTLRSTGS